MSRLRVFSLPLSLLLVLASLLPARIVRAQTGDAVDRVGGLYWQMDATLRATPQVDGTVAFTLAASPYQPAPDLFFTWELPDGGELLDGPADGSAGPVTARGTVQQSRQVRFPGPGTYTVRAVAGYRPDASVRYSAAGVLFVIIDAAGSIAISDQD
ncbi:MAG: hypothetical protein KDD83_26170, partial [Caldilineaceae bacterium]|nr:hypothetical protein [Caldilineaceae bacterium]